MVASNGYILVRVGKNHPLADVRGYAYEHRVVAEEKIGRSLLDNEHVHHVDENKQNNSPENLEVLTTQEHRFQHRKTSGKRAPGEENPMVACACGCEQTFTRYDGINRPRKFLPGHNPQEGTTKKFLLSALANGPKRKKDLAAESGIKPKSISTCLNKMKIAGLVENPKHGLWRLSVQQFPAL